MEQQKFKYKGKELIKPLSDLSVLIQDKMRKLKVDVNNFETNNKGSINGLSMMEKSVDPVYKKYASMCRDYEVFKNDLEKTINWLRECRRAPRACYVFDLQDLNWLYRH